MKEQVYAARVVEKVDNGPGVMNSVRVGVFLGDERVGEYTRNYSCLLNTFFPFKSGGDWYALYSPDYTATRLMSLPDCKDLGGEGPNARGFCPAEFLVPEVTAQEIKADDPKPYNPRHDPDRWATKGDKGVYTYSSDPDGEYALACKKFDAEYDLWTKRNPFVTRHDDWGLVAGCVWGDDSSWKVQYLDLSRVREGVLTRDDRFGYLELPGGVSLKDAVTVQYYDFNKMSADKWIEIAVPARFNLEGKRCKD